jgi:WD40 repeat protein
MTAGLGLLAAGLHVANRSAADQAPRADALPKDALARLGTTHFRHGSRILALAYSPGDKILAAGGGFDPVRLWDAQSGKALGQLNESMVYALAFAPEGNLLATGGGFKIIRLWDTASGKQVAELKGHEGAVKALAFSADGKYLVSGGQDRTVRLWEIPSGKHLAKMVGHEDEVNAVAFSRDGKTVASGSGDYSVRLWQVPSGDASPVRIMAGGAVAALAFSPDGKTLATAGDDNHIRLWNAESGAPARQWRAHVKPVVSLRYTDDGKALASGSFDRSARLWDPDSGKETLQIKLGRGDVDALALAHDGKVLATAGLDGAIRRWNTGTGKEIVSEKGPEAPVLAVAVSADGRQIVTADGRGELGIWDRAGKRLAHVAGHTGGEPVLALSPKGNFLAVAGPREVAVWIVGEKGGPTATIKIDDEGKGSENAAVVALAFSPDGKQLAIGSRGRGVRLYGMEDGKVVKLAYPGAALALAFTADGKTLAAGGTDKVILWETGTGTELRRIGKSGPGTEVASLAFTPDGKTLAAGMFDSTLHLWDPATGKELKVIEGHTSAVFAVAFSATGRYFVTASFDKSVRLWETASGQQVAQWSGHRGAADAVSLTPDGRQAVSGGTDCCALIWDVTGLSPGGKLPALGADATGGLWDVLALEDTPRASKAVWTLVAAGKAGSDLLAKSVYVTDPKKLDQLFKDLDSPRFAVREKAMVALEKYGKWIQGRLEKESENPPSLEVERRLKSLLKKLTVSGALSLGQERLRTRRAMEALEQLATPEARDVLRRLSEGAPEVELRHEAQASLDRLGRPRTPEVK